MHFSHSFRMTWLFKAQWPSPKPSSSAEGLVSIIPKALRVNELMVILTPVFWLLLAIGCEVIQVGYPRNTSIHPRFQMTRGEQTAQTRRTIKILRKPCICFLFYLVITL